MNISIQWYKETFKEHIISEYGSMEILKKNDSIRDEQIRIYMYKQVAQKYSLGNVSDMMDTNKKLCSECINEYKR